MAQAPGFGNESLRRGQTLGEDKQAAFRAEIDSRQANVVVYSADGAIDATLTHVAMITKTSAAAMTLAAPAVDGIEIIIQAGSAFAHVVTATGLLQDGVTGGAKNAYTTAAFVGSGATFISYNGKWHLIAKQLGGVA